MSTQTPPLQSIKNGPIAIKAEDQQQSTLNQQFKSIDWDSEQQLISSLAKLQELESKVRPRPSPHPLPTTQHANRGDGMEYVDPRTPFFTTRQTPRSSKPNHKPSPPIITHHLIPISQHDPAQPSGSKRLTPQIRGRGSRRNQQLQRVMDKRGYGEYMAQGG